MDLLSRREHSREELRRKLTAREVPAEEIETALDRLVKEGLASDDRFAEAFVSSRLRRGQGPQRIRRELETRGVDPGLAEAELADADWTASARAVREKKFGPDLPGDFQERARQARFLQYRGFTGEQIRQALGGAGDED
jgi:regulatory protein